ncbi:phosphatidylethanolamine-binding protein [Aspergillus floccosus]
MHLFMPTLLVLLWSTVQALPPQGLQHKLLTRGPAFAGLPNATIKIHSTDLGASESQLGIDFTLDGAGFFPALSWKRPARVTVCEYVLVSEDADADAEKPILHGLYYGIPPVFTGLTNDDFAIDTSRKEPYSLKGGFRYGRNLGLTTYMPPSPPLGRGPHRYFFQLVALGNPLDRKRMESFASLENITSEIQGKVVGWGDWVGVYERK